MPSNLRPLEGIRVVEMTHMIMGPSCGMFLAFLGAEVIKVEPPEGDKTRNLSGMGAAFFPTFNRGKKSIVLDTATAEGREAFGKLLATADIFVENFRDVSLRKMGFDAESLRAKYPKLVVVSCKGFLHGPYENRTAMDEVVQMMTGMAYMTGPTGRPLRIGSSANDIMAGLFGAFAALAGLYARRESGTGEALRIGLFENCLLLIAQHMVEFDLEGTEAPPMPDRKFSWPVYDIFTTRDGKPLFVGAVTEGQWKSLCGVLGLGEFLADPRLQNRRDQISARKWTVPVIAQAIAERDANELVAELENIGIPFSPVARPAEMYDDPHVNRPSGLLSSRYPDGRLFRAPGLPFEVDGRPLTPQTADVPAVGENTREILAELGLAAPPKAAAGKGG